MGMEKGGKFATAKELEAAIEKHHQVAFDNRRLVVLTNQAYYQKGTTKLGRVQVYDIITKQLLFNASSNYAAIKKLEDGWTFSNGPTGGFFKAATIRKKKLSKQRQRDMDHQERILIPVRRKK